MNCEYLGVFLSDSGSLMNDVKLYIDYKRANVSIKFTNFCKNILEVLDKCVSSVFSYVCETWGRCIGDVEPCYRSGLKTALNVRVNHNDEIVYIESGKWPLCS